MLGELQLQTNTPYSNSNTHTHTLINHTSHYSWLKGAAKKQCYIEAFKINFNYVEKINF